MSNFLRNLCATAALGGFVFCQGCDPAGSTSPSDSSDAPPSRAVDVAVVVLRPVDRVVTAVGTLAAWSESLISSKVSGRLAGIEVDLGSRVQSGDVLARIEARDYELQLLQAQAALSQARAGLGLPLEDGGDIIDAAETTAVREATAMLEEAASNRDRVLRLSGQGIVSQSELDAVEIAHRVARNRHAAALEEVRRRQAMVSQRRAEAAIAQENLNATELRAPFDGIIQARHTHPGEFLRAGDPVVTLVAVDPLRLQIEAPEREASRIRAGQNVRVRVSGSDTEREVELSRVSPALTAQDRVLRMEADVPNKDGLLHAGSFAHAEIVVEPNAEALTVPSEAVRVFAGVEKVFVAREGRAEEIEVQTGSHGDGWVEIVKGLEEGQQVVLSPGSMRDGDAVQAKQTKSLNGTE